MFKVLSVLIFCLFLNFQTLAVEDGKYIGAWKTTYAHSESTSAKGDTGIFEFTIQDNKIVKIFTPDDPNLESFKLKYFYKINPKTNELHGYALGYDASTSSRFRINLKGVFVNNKFAGEGNTELMPESLIIDKFVFESIE